MNAVRKVRRVKVMIDLGYSSCRDMLTGISEYVRRNHSPWQISLHPNPRDAAPGDIDTQVDGFIVNDAVATNCRDALCARNVPIVVTGSQDDFPNTRHQRVSFVHNDNIGLGELGAKHLLSLGQFRSYAFVSEPGDPLWCRQRCEGFRRTLAARNLRLWTQGSLSLADFLVRLPTPTAIFCATDKIGFEVAAVCNGANVQIPKDAVILGVDNDPVLCEIANPPLSSIKVDHVRYGMVAAEALNRLFNRQVPGKPAEILITRFKIVKRKSTTPIATSIHLVERAIQYVRDNALNNPSVDDVIAHLGVSRQLVYLRFSETSVGTLAKFILDTRLGEVANRLRKTKLPIVQIAKTCSFDNLQHLANAFKRRYGVSMTDYRANRLRK